MKPLRVNTLKDHANFFLHIGLAATATTGTFLTLGSPVVLGGIALGITAAVQLGLVRVVKDALQGAIDEERIGNLKDSITKRLSPAEKADYYYEKNRLSRITGWVEKFADRSGLKEVPKLLIMEKPDPLEVMRDKIIGTRNLGLRGFLRKEFTKKANAFAFQHERGNVVLNEPIVDALDERELAGVVGHEVGHLAAGHHIRREAISWITGPATIMAGLNKFIVSISSWKNFGLVFAAGVITNAAGDAIARAKGWEVEKEDEFGNEEGGKDKPKLDACKRYILAGVTAGLAVMFGAPDLLIATGISFATREASNLIHKSMSRRNEFQADRLGAELAQDTVGLRTGLEKIRTLNLKAEPGFNHDQKKKDEGPLSRIFSAVKDLKATHPNVDRRVDRLQSMPFAGNAWQPI